MADYREGADGIFSDLDSQVASFDTITKRDEWPIDFSTPRFPKGGEKDTKTRVSDSGVSTMFKTRQTDQGFGARPKQGVRNPSAIGVEEEIKVLEARLEQMNVESSRLRRETEKRTLSAAVGPDYFQEKNVRGASRSTETRFDVDRGSPDRVTYRKHKNRERRPERWGEEDDDDDSEQEHFGRHVKAHRKSISVKAATYDGSASWVDYKSHFEACARINKWTEEDKGLYLAVALRGQAQGILGDLAITQQQNYKSLVKALEERFAPPDQTELYRVQLNERRQRAAESLPELGQAIRRLVNLAYPTVPSDVRETLAKQQFIEALADSEMRIRIKQARPRNLTEATRLAVELEAYNKAEKKWKEGQSYLRSAVVEVEAEEVSKGDSDKPDMVTMLGDIQKKLKVLQNEVHKLKTVQKGDTQPTRRASGKDKKACYHCKEEGHFRRECPKLRNKATEQGDKTQQAAAKQVRTQNSNERDTAFANIGASSAAQEAGMYIDASVHGSKVKLLVDTGATVTLISDRVYEGIPDAAKPTLRELHHEVLTAGGSELQVAGRGGFVLKLDDSKEVYVEAVVAKISVDGILGLDVMKERKGALDFDKGFLVLDGTRINTSYQGGTGCFRVCAMEKVTVPAESEIILAGKVCPPPGKQLQGNALLIEGTESFIKSDRALIGRALVANEPTIPVRMMNLSNEAKIIYPGTTIAQVSAVQNIVDESEVVKRKNSNGELRQDLSQLLGASKENLTEEQTEIVGNLLRKYERLFAASDDELGRTNVVKHKINTGNAHPIKQPLRRVPGHLGPEVDKQVKQMLDQGVIQRSSSPWSSGIVLVKKKDGSMRFCVDYRRLNAVSTPDAYPLPRIDEALDQLSGCSWFSTLDLNSGYWQVEIEPEDRPKTAFATRTGLYEFQVMPFGLTSAPATFERLMETVLAGLQWQICLIYLDDIIVVGKSFQDMIENLQKVFDRLLTAGLTLKARKCCLFAKKVLYLGHVVSKEGIATDPTKVKIVELWHTPTNVRELRSFLGFCSYYRRFIKGFSKIAKCLHRLTEKGRKFEWSPLCNEAFERLKECLVNAPVLAHPDFTKDFILDTDASMDAIGSVLSQVIDGVERPIAYAGRTLTKAERRYCVTRKELLGVVYFVKYFRHYLYGRKFTVRTDHSSLRWLMNFKDPEGQMARWLQVLSSYNMDIVHRPGAQHRNADSLSRIPCRQCGFDPEWESKMKKDYQPQSVLQVKQAKGGQKQDNPKTETEDSELLIQDIQEVDKDIRMVKEWVKEGTKPHFKSISGRNMVVKSLWSQFETLFIHENILYRRGVGGVLQVVIPKSERRTVLAHVHDSKCAGHLGLKKTLTRVRQGFYWPGMQGDVKRYVAGCLQCCKGKNPNRGKRAPMQVEETGYPMERIAMDILCELPETDRGNRHILVLSDYYTKWTESFAMPNMEAKTVAQLLVEEVICRFGVPSVVHTDQGSQFESALFKEVCRLLQIHKTRTTPYHPKSDGMVERFNKTLVTMLRSFVNDRQTDWDEHLPYIMMAYRSAEHETTSSTPNFMMLGRETSTPLDIQYSLPRNLKSIPQNQWAWQLQERMEDAHHVVRENVKGAILRQKRIHDQKLSWQNFQPGEEVFVFFPNVKIGRTHKLACRWQGPYKVLERVTDVTFKVNCGRKGRPQVIHVDRMRKKQTQILNGEKVEDYARMKDQIIQVDESCFGKQKESLNAGSECDLSLLSEVKRGLTDHKPLNVESGGGEPTPINQGLSSRVRRPPAWHSDYTMRY